MTYLYHIIIGSCLVVFQTVMLPHFPFSSSIYDILIPFLIYLGAYRPARESIPVAVVLGFIVDSLSGSYFGVYIITYMWLTIIIRWVSTLIDLENYLLLLLIFIIGVLIENLILFVAVSIANPVFQFSTSIVSGIAVQIFWILCTGPFLLIFFGRIFDVLNIEQE